MFVIIDINYQLKRYINLSQQKPSKYIKNYYASIVPLIALLWFDINSLMLTLSPLLSTSNISSSQYNA
ncbi:hypothetical protein BLOT_013766 [Blomia tropicalis]|nr:hypothetical protein BLOT_013766 [Blomia tropicalis]